jgi:hypothetical protein
MIAGFCVRSVSGRNILPGSGPIAGGNDKKATAGFRTCDDEVELGEYQQVLAAVRTLN